MLNKDILFFAGADGAGEQTIGEAGGQGFGVGVYGGDEADLTAMGLSPMDGCNDPASDNYGNYIHTNGSIMVFIPAFCYRIGNSAAPSYSRDTVNALEIRSATEFANYEAGAAATGDMGDGWVLHRAFIDSGVQKRGFFIDKYLCSKSASNSNIAVSVKNADPLQLTTSSSDNTTSGMTNCSGRLYDALTLSAARGSDYGCMTIFMFSALGMLSIAHGQAATSTAYCAWFDSSYTTNYPKGNNNSLKDIDDTSVTFTQSSKTSYAVGKTGSASNFAKCTHNGQNCGVYGVNCDLYQVTVGFAFKSTSSVYILKESSKFNVITKDNYSSSSSYYDTFSVTAMGGTGADWNYWNPSSAMFYSDVSGGGRALCGVYPKSYISTSTSSKTLFGKDGFYNYSESYTGTNRVLLVGGYYGDSTKAGVWFRLWANYTWNNNYYYLSGFRAAAYAG